MYYAINQQADLWMTHSKELLLMNYKNQIMIIWYIICLEMVFWLQNTIKYGIDVYRSENI